MDEGVLEVDEVAVDRVVELCGFGELHGVGLIKSEGKSSSRVTKVPFSEFRKLLIVTESPSVMKKRRKK